MWTLAVFRPVAEAVDQCELLDERIGLFSSDEAKSCDRECSRSINTMGEGGPTRLGFEGRFCHDLPYQGASRIHGSLQRH